MAYVWIRIKGDYVRWIKKVLLTKENLYALLLCLLIALLVIFSADRTPLWIYQGF
jgi:hypothetical protein